MMEIQFGEESRKSTSVSVDRKKATAKSKGRDDVRCVALPFQMSIRVKVVVEVEASLPALLKRLAASCSGHLCLHMYVPR